MFDGSPNTSHVYLQVPLKYIGIFVVSMAFPALDSITKEKARRSCFQMLHKLPFSCQQNDSCNLLQPAWAWRRGAELMRFACCIAKPSDCRHVCHLFDGRRCSAMQKKS